MRMRGSNEDARQGRQSPREKRPCIGRRPLSSRRAVATRGSRQTRTHGLWSIARRLAERLRAIGITTPLELRDADRRPARSGTDRPGRLLLRPRLRGVGDERRGLLSTVQALVAQVTRERRQAARNTGTPSARKVPDEYLTAAGKRRKRSADRVSEVRRREMRVMLLRHPRVGMAKLSGDNAHGHAAHGQR
jgi:hypothetical protein